MQPKRLLWVSLAAALCTTLVAQSAVSPKGFNAIEGAGFAHIFGRYANGRFQFAEGDLRGTALSIGGVSYRLDHRSHTAETAMGRKWTTVTLQVAECNYDAIGRLWNRNALTTPSRVFNGSVHWLSHTGKPLVKPSIWGSLKRDLVFPFSSPFKFGGKNDLLLDYQFAGGSLDNSGSWNFTDPRFYYLDGQSISTNPRSGISIGFPIAGACADSSLSQFPGAASSIAAITYSDKDPNPKFSGKLRIYHETTFTAPNAPVLQALGLAGKPAGVSIGARCNKLFINLGQLWFPISGTADPNGQSGRSEYAAAWVPGFANLQLWTQGVWIDSKTGALSLTRARQVTVPGGKPPSVAPRKKVVFHYLTNLGLGIGPEARHDHNPFLKIN